MTKQKTIRLLTLLIGQALHATDLTRSTKQLTHIDCQITSVTLSCFTSSTCLLLLLKDHSVFLMA